MTNNLRVARIDDAVNNSIFSWQQLSNKINVEKLWNIIHRTKPNAKIIANLANVLGYNTDWFYGCDIQPLKRMPVIKQSKDTICFSDPMTKSVLRIEKSNNAELLLLTITSAEAESVCIPFGITDQDAINKTINGIKNIINNKQADPFTWNWVGKEVYLTVSNSNGNVVIELESRNAMKQVNYVSCCSEHNDLINLLIELKSLNENITHNFKYDSNNNNNAIRKVNGYKLDAKELYDSNYGLDEYTVNKIHDLFNLHYSKESGNGFTLIANKLNLPYSVVRDICIHENFCKINDLKRKDILLGTSDFRRLYNEYQNGNTTLQKISTLLNISVGMASSLVELVHSDYGSKFIFTNVLGTNEDINMVCCDKLYGVGIIHYRELPLDDEYLIEHDFFLPEENLNRLKELLPYYSLRLTFLAMSYEANIPYPMAHAIGMKLCNKKCRLSKTDALFNTPEYKRLYNKMFDGDISKINMHRELNVTDGVCYTCISLTKKYYGNDFKYNLSKDKSLDDKHIDDNKSLSTIDDNINLKPQSVESEQQSYCYDNRITHYQNCMGNTPLYNYGDMSYMSPYMGPCNPMYNQGAEMYNPAMGMFNQSIQYKQMAFSFANVPNTSVVETPHKEVIVNTKANDDIDSIIKIITDLKDSGAYRIIKRLNALNDEDKKFALELIEGIVDKFSK